MCVDQNEIRRRDRQQQPQEEEITVNELLSAISETEYPQYVLDAVAKIQEWMNDTVTNQDDHEESDIFAAIFNDIFDDGADSIEGLFERLNEIEEFADVLPNSRKPDGKPDTIIITSSPPA
mgnify:CR=1 FL=1